MIGQEPPPYDLIAETLQREARAAELEKWRRWHWLRHRWSVWGEVRLLDSQWSTACWQDRRCLVCNKVQRRVP